MQRDTTRLAGTRNKIHINGGAEAGISVPVKGINAHISCRTGLRKKRTQFSTGQIVKLESAFKMNRYPSIEDKKAIAGDTGLSAKQVTVWFQNRRYRERHPNCSLKAVHSSSLQQPGTSTYGGGSFSGQNIYPNPILISNHSGNISALCNTQFGSSSAVGTHTLSSIVTDPVFMGYQANMPYHNFSPMPYQLNQQPTIKTGRPDS